MAQRYGIIFFEHMGNQSIPAFIREVKTARTHLGAKRIAMGLVRKYRPQRLEWRGGLVHNTAETYSHTFVDSSGFVIIKND
jgi:hypothetical protein